jgi:hypothetical protein
MPHTDIQHDPTFNRARNAFLHQYIESWRWTHTRLFEDYPGKKSEATSCVNTGSSCSWPISKASRWNRAGLPSTSDCR